MTEHRFRSSLACPSDPDQARRARLILAARQSAVELTAKVEAILAAHRRASPGAER